MPTLQSEPSMEPAVANSWNISITLTAEQMANLQAAVASGTYASADGIVREAITAWRLAHALTDDEIQSLGSLWDAGRPTARRSPSTSSGHWQLTRTAGQSSR